MKEKTETKAKPRAKRTTARKGVEGKQETHKAIGSQRGKGKSRRV